MGRFYILFPCCTHRILQLERKYDEMFNTQYTHVNVLRIIQSLAWLVERHFRSRLRSNCRPVNHQHFGPALRKQPIRKIDCNSVLVSEIGFYFLGMSLLLQYKSNTNSINIRLFWSVVTVYLLLLQIFYTYYFNLRLVQIPDQVGIFWVVGTEGKKY